MKAKARIKSNGRFRSLLIRTIKQAKNINFSILNFQRFSIPEKTNTRYNFHPATKGQKGLFFFKDSQTNKIIAYGATTKCLYNQIMIRIYRFKIPSSAKLAIIVCPEKLVDVIRRKIIDSYNSTPIYDAHCKIVKAIDRGQAIPLEAIKFFDLYSKEGRSIRNTKRQMTNLNHLVGRQGIYLLLETEKGKEDWEMVYNGLASGKNPDLARRIYHHFVKDRYDQSPRNNYYYKLETHDYRIGAVDVCMTNLSRKEFKDYLSGLEKLFIKQFNPRDNIIHKDIKTTPEQSINFDEGERWTPPTTIPEVAGTFEIAPF